MRTRLCLALLLMSSLLGACSVTRQRTLEGRVFDVPKANDITDSDAPFFLPKLDPNDGFSFYLNPGARLPELNLVSVASKRRMCERAAGTEAFINATVCAVHPPSWRNRQLKKVSDGIFSTYDLPAEAGKKPPALASCISMGGGSRPDLCTANMLFGNLVLTIHFRENQIGSLASLHDQATDNLLRWER